MSSSRLMDTRPEHEPRRGMSKSLALALVGLAGLIFMCSLMAWIGSSLTGLFSEDVKAQSGNPGDGIAIYGNREIFPVLTVEDRVNCLARVNWHIVSIQTPTGIVFECHPE